jgi:hypothetical protein
VFRLVLSSLLLILKKPSRQLGIPVLEDAALQNNGLLHSFHQLFLIGNYAGNYIFFVNGLPFVCPVPDMVTLRCYKFQERDRVQRVLRESDARIRSRIYS